jgi:hypothetical protein
MRHHSRSAPARSHGRSRGRHRLRGLVTAAAVLALSVSGVVAASTSAQAASIDTGAE